MRESAISRALATVLLVLAALFLLGVVLSLIPSDTWFLRVTDLVREPVSYVAALFLLVAMFVGPRWRWATVAMLGLAIAINVWRIGPYSALAVTQIDLGDAARAPTDASCFSAMSANVKVENGDHARLAAQLRRHDPDLLLLLETDARWIAVLEPMLARYPHVQRHPQPDGFGLVFATRLPLLKAKVVENTYRDTPTLYATVRPRGVQPIEFIGLHPKPPLPQWNTRLRDQNIVDAGIRTPDRLPDAFVMGDFNDVPWSQTTTRFRERGDWRDPRIGRGTFPTYPASMLFIGWPLDQLMLKGRLQLTSFEVLPDNGSDHRAMLARFCMPGPAR